MRLFDLPILLLTSSTGMPSTVARSGDVTIPTANRRVLVHARARPLPEGVADLLIANTETLKLMQTELRQQRKSKGADVENDDDDDGHGGSGGSGVIDDARVLMAKLGELFAAAGPEWVGKEKKIVSCLCR